MAEKRLRLSFLERDYFAGSRDGTHVKGFEPAIIRVGGELKVGRVVDLERLGQAEFTDTILFQAEIELKDCNLPLDELMLGNEEAREWLEKHKQMFRDAYREEVPMVFSVACLEMPLLKYEIFPPNYFKRERSYMPPRGLIEKLLKRAVYAEVLPPMKFADGKWIPNVYYKREAHLPNGEVWSASMQDTNDDNPFRQARGTLLGSLAFGEVKQSYESRAGRFEPEYFPIKNFLEVCYPIGLRDREHNPLTIKVELVD